MSNNETGREPAFPSPMSLYINHIGLTKREYFAAAALQGMCVNNTQSNPELISVWAYGFADAMIAQGEK